MSISKNNDLAAPVPLDQASAVPIGSLTLENYEGSEVPISYVISLYDDVLEYNSDGSIPSAGGIKKPKFFSLHGAPSALTLRFVGGSCWDSDNKPKTFRIEMKTTQSFATTPLLEINDILRSATAAHDGPNPSDGVVIPGLRILSVYRGKDTGPSFDYSDKMCCIHIYRSKVQEK